VQQLLGSEPEPFKDEVQASHRLDYEYGIENSDDECRIQLDDQAFEKLRLNLMGDIHAISCKLRHQQNLKKIRQDTLVGMIAGPVAFK